MLTEVVRSDEAYFDELREREFSRLARTGEAYLDYTGSALYTDSQVRAHAALMADGLFGNPHSEHRASRASTAVIDAARRRTLVWLDADEESYDLCFTANATAAIKLVAESYWFGPDVPLVLTADNHNSVNGIREYAGRRGSPVFSLPLDEQLRLADPVARLGRLRCPRGLFAFPAQSNFSGVQHPLSLVASAQALGFDVLLDAASYLPAHALSLRRHPAAFVALSFTKCSAIPPASARWSPVATRWLDWSGPGLPGAQWPTPRCNSEDSDGARGTTGSRTAPPIFSRSRRSVPGSTC
jgi:selenocysteine lyase/cysteine desulfurase